LKVSIVEYRRNDNTDPTLWKASMTKAEPKDE